RRWSRSWPQPIAAVAALRTSRETAESAPPGTSRRGHLACRKTELPVPDDAAKCTPIAGRCTRSSPPPRFVEGPSFHQGFDLSLEGLASFPRSEERRVGKEWRSRWMS